MFRRFLTPEQAIERKRLGLCYNCEKFTSAHECKQLLHIEFVNVVAADTDDLDEKPNPKISLHASTNINTDRTMQLEVTVCDVVLMALVDAGSTHNFVAEEICSRLNWPMQAGR